MTKFQIAELTHRFEIATFEMRRKKSTRSRKIKCRPFQLKRDKELWLKFKTTFDESLHVDYITRARSSNSACRKLSPCLSVFELLMWRIFHGNSSVIRPISSFLKTLDRACNLNAIFSLIHFSRNFELFRIFFRKTHWIHILWSLSSSSTPFCMCKMKCDLTHTHTHPKLKKL